MMGMVLKIIICSPLRFPINSLKKQTMELFLKFDSKNLSTVNQSRLVISSSFSLLWKKNLGHKRSIYWPLLRLNDLPCERKVWKNRGTMNYVGRYILLRAKVKDFAILELQVQPENKMIFVVHSTSILLFVRIFWKDRDDWK